MIDISDADIEPTPTFGTTITREFIRGMGKVQSNFIPIIDTDKALSVDDMAAIVESQHR